MPRIKDNVRVVNAKLGVGTFNNVGTYFATNNSVDGWSVIRILANGVEESVKKYLEGDTSIIGYTIPSNVNKLCNYSLASFPNIETIYITNYEEVIDLSATDVFGGLADDPTIYVPSKFLSSYQSEYPSYNFVSFVDNNDLYIANNGSNNLTVEYVNSVINGLTIGENASITRTFVGSDFTTFEFGAMDFVFDGKVPNSTIELDNEIYFLSITYNDSQSGAVLEVE